MTTILVINAVSSLLAAFGVAGFLVRKNRRVRRNAVAEPVYVTTRRMR
jgi:hypothetical protein